MNDLFEELGFDIDHRASRWDAERTDDFDTVEDEDDEEFEFEDEDEPLY